ncbi:MAG: aspartate aminotransferase family protein [Gammaproteobacteria bacterium]|jgi:acetylornithine/N-succinyldiaminopimelate aminotransferase
MSDALMPTYNRLPIEFVRGQGVHLWDSEGREYLDALSGIAVCGLGHAHPAVAEALCEQAQTLIHTSNVYRIPHQEQLGQRLCALADMDRVFFSNSGAEANEAAIKLARRYGRQRGIETPRIVVMETSFHGRTLATLTATGNPKVQAGFEPLVEGFVRVPYDDLSAVEQLAGDGDIVAILVEPVQGEGGINIPAPDYLNGLRALCDRTGWLLMLDEIQTGMGRSGRWFAHQHNGIRPDVMTLAKALGNGVPIGACLARGPAAEVLGPGTHGSTYGGNPLVCRTGLAVIDTLETQNLPARAAELGERMQSTFRDRLAGVNGVKAIRGLGLLLGIELDRPCGVLVGRALEKGLLINVTAECVVRLLPPLIITNDEADQIVNGVSDLVIELLAEETAA